MTIIVTALSSLSRRIWPYALVAAISVWCRYGWHVELTALFPSTVSQGLRCMKSRSQKSRSQALKARPGQESISNSSFMPPAPKRRAPLLAMFILC